jgi:hypothetical protein
VGSKVNGCEWVDASVFKPMETRAFARVWIGGYKTSKVTPGE